MSSDNEEYSSNQHLKSRSNAPKKQSSIRSFLVSKDVKSEQLDEEQPRNESIDTLDESDDSFEEDQVDLLPSKPKSKRKQKSYPKKQGECVECKKFSKRLTKQLCIACYERARRTLPEYNIPNCCCIECMAVAKVDKHGRCRKCCAAKNNKQRKANVDKHRECKECKQTKLIVSNGLCNKCYLRSKPKVKGTCQECGQTKILENKKFCANCQQKKRAKTDIRMCKNCGIMKPHKADQMCRPCYMETRREDKRKHKECVRCGQTNFIEGRGMCQTCCTQTRKADTAKHKECVRCNKIKFIKGHGMCISCYSKDTAQRLKLDTSQHKECTKCKKTKLIYARECCNTCYQKIFVRPKAAAKKKLAKKNKQIKAEPIDDVKIEELDNEPGPSWR